MYQSKMAFAIKVNGKILKEFKDTVYIPFGSEYSILIKNLHTTRAVVNVFIDGVNQTPSGLVVNALSECNFERSLLNGSLTTGNKFKFIERTSAVEEHRGVQLEDGLVRLEYQFESTTQIRTPFMYQDQNQNLGHYYNGLKVGDNNSPLTVDRSWLRASGATVNNTTNISGTITNGVYNVGGVMRSADMSKGQMTATVATAAVNQYCVDNGIKNSSGEVHDGAATMDSYFNESGITVSGSKSTQQFATTYMGRMDPEKFSMVIKLLGQTPDNKPVLQPVNVKMKPRCQTCGRQNRASAKFCAECGTHLEIFA